MQSLQLRNPEQQQNSNLFFHDIKPKAVDQKREIINGLLQKEKTISPKYFYDETGSQLFDQITALDEYYLTRSEQSIFEQHGKAICDHLSDETILIEPGSGNSEKIRILFRHYQPAGYAPIEISEAYLKQAAQQLTDDYPEITVHAVCGDFTEIQAMPPSIPSSPRAAFFPGSTIGNFEPADATRLLRNIHRILGREGKLLIGVDLIKDVSILNAAYNDAQGVTARFNLNLLRHISRIVAHDFDLDNFSHRAFYNQALNRIEMHLQCQKSHTITLDNQRVDFKKGETVHTENSYKYSVDSFEALARQAGFKRTQTWTDSDNYFSFHCFVAI